MFRYPSNMSLFVHKFRSEIAKVNFAHNIGHLHLLQSVVLNSHRPPRDRIVCVHCHVMCFPDIEWISFAIKANQSMDRLPPGLIWADRITGDMFLPQIAVASNGHEAACRYIYIHTAVQLSQTCHSDLITRHVIT